MSPTSRIDSTKKGISIMRKLVIAFCFLTFAMGCAGRTAPEAQRSAKIEVVKNIDAPRGEHIVMAPPK
jgi:hypothetical protein